MRTLPTALVLAALAALLGLGPVALPSSARAGEDAADELTIHPMKDAKPGEFVRYVEEKDGWKKWFVERVVDVKDGEVYWQVAQTDEEGTKDYSVVYGAWVEVPEFKAGPFQTVLKDEMVDLTIEGHKLRCRHVFVEQPVEPPYPEPKFRREVWYSNEVPCSGKVREVSPNVGTRVVVSWGMMPDDELKRRQEGLRGKTEPGTE